MGPGCTTAVWKGSEAFNTIQNHLEPYTTCSNHTYNQQFGPGLTTSLWNRPESSKSKKNLKDTCRTWYNYPNSAITILNWPIKQDRNQGSTQKAINMSGQNLPLPSKTGQNHPTPNRTTKSYTKPVTTIPKPPQLVSIIKNDLKLTIAIMQHLNEAQTQENNPQVGPGPTFTALNRTEPPNTIQNHQGPYKTCREAPQSCQN